MYILVQSNCETNKQTTLDSEMTYSLTSYNDYMKLIIGFR